MERRTIQKVYDLDVYNLSYSLALEVFLLTKKFPKEETYSLTDQIRRSSRSIPVNISEGFAKRKYENIFKNHLITAIGSSEETKTWLDFARDFTYLSKEDVEKIKGKYSELGAMLFRMVQNWKSY
jgi:four helix bundle protein